jgi:hypothetical protein
MTELKESRLRMITIVKTIGKMMERYWVRDEMAWTAERVSRLLGTTSRRLWLRWHEQLNAFHVCLEQHLVGSG